MLSRPSDAAERVRTSSTSARSKIVFAAVGLRRTVGGIAAASCNVELALRKLAAARGCSFAVHVLAEAPEPGDATRTYVAHGGSKVRFTLALVGALVRAELAVFDHVRLALPLLALPRLLRPKVVICAHGSESWKRIRPSSRRLFRMADLVLTNSSYTLTRMRDTLTASKARSVNSACHRSTTHHPRRRQRRVRS